MIKVLIVDDLNIVREGVKMFLAEKEDIELIGSAPNGFEAIKLMKESGRLPDVVVMDLIMPKMGGIEATEKIVQEFPSVKVMILSNLDNIKTASTVIASGAKGYLLKSKIEEDLANAVRAVHSGYAQVDPVIVTQIAEKGHPTQNNPAQTPKTVPHKNLSNSQAQVKSDTIPDPWSKDTTKAQVKNAPIQPKSGSNSSKKTKAKAKGVKPEKPLFEYGDWIAIALATYLLSRIEGMGHHLGHAGMFLLMLALAARPTRSLWSAPMKHRRAIGVFAFAATVGHALYATNYILNTNLGAIFFASSQHSWGMWTGIIALAVMTPAAVTSFQFFQKKLGKRWRQIHLLTLPSMGLAVLHTILIGPHYVGQFQIELVDLIRTFTVVILGILTFLVRKRPLKKVKSASTNNTKQKNDSKKQKFASTVELEKQEKGKI